MSDADADGVCQHRPHISSRTVPQKRHRPYSGNKSSHGSQSEHGEPVTLTHRVQHGAAVWIVAGFEDAFHYDILIT